MCPGRQRVLLFSSVLFYLIIQFWLKFCLCPAIRYNPTGNLLQRKLPLMSNCKKLPQIQWVSIKHAPSLTARELERGCRGAQCKIIVKFKVLRAKICSHSQKILNFLLLHWQKTFFHLKASWQCPSSSKFLTARSSNSDFLNYSLLATL